MQTIRAQHRLANAASAISPNASGVQNGLKPLTETVVAIAPTSADAARNRAVPRMEGESKAQKHPVARAGKKPPINTVIVAKMTIMGRVTKSSHACSRTGRIPAPEWITTKKHGPNR